MYFAGSSYSLPADRPSSPDASSGMKIGSSGNRSFKGSSGSGNGNVGSSLGSHYASANSGCSSDRGSGTSCFQNIWQVQSLVFIYVLWLLYLSVDHVPYPLTPFGKIIVKIIQYWHSLFTSHEQCPCYSQYIFYTERGILHDSIKYLKLAKKLPLRLVGLSRDFFKSLRHIIDQVVRFIKT